MRMPKFEMAVPGKMRRKDAEWLAYELNQRPNRTGWYQAVYHGKSKGWLAVTTKPDGEKLGLGNGKFYNLK